MKEFKTADLHVHTNFSPDSHARMEEYVQRAINIGLDVLCFTDHVDCSDLEYTFNPDQLQRRVDEFERVRDKYADAGVKLLLGVEFAEPHLHEAEFEYVKKLPLDMIIGSVHYPLDYAMRELRHYSRREYEEIYNKCVCDMLTHGGFDVLGHMDLPKRYHDDYAPDNMALINNARLCAEKGIVPELNTSTLRGGLKETMPSVDIIAAYRDFGGKYVMINSDSHAPEYLGTNYDKVKSTLPDGVECCYFEKRVLKVLK
jgi:histidinol-phosphatase (PHP family)